LAREKRAPSISVDDTPEYVALNDILFYDYEALDGKIERARDVIVKRWVESDDPAPWSLAWSGGKDSTATLKLVTEAILTLPDDQRRKRPLRVVSSDTRMENPNIEVYLHEQSRLFNEWATSLGLDWSSTIVSRPLKRAFFYLIIGKGYPIPGNTGRRRWCTHALKIEPNEKFYEEVHPLLVIVGTRNNESTRRDGVMAKYRTDDEFFQTSLNGKYMVMTPVIEFMVEDIWAYLALDTAWSSTEAVKTLYKDATGECGFQNPRKANDPGEEAMVKTCGARFGCWTCPPVQDDKSTEKMSETHRWMKPLTEWRELLKRTYGVWIPSKVDGETRKERSARLAESRLVNGAARIANKSGFRRNGAYIGEGMGNIRISVRKTLLATLLETQDNVNTLRELEGLEPIRLIQDDELHAIYAQWVVDARNGMAI
jgi:DNA sulfur modification protein DndC